MHHLWLQKLTDFTHFNHIIKILLTHWGRVAHICVRKLAIIDSDNGLTPGRCQAIICWNILNGALGNKLQWNLHRNLYIFIQENVFENVVLKMTAICLGLNVLIIIIHPVSHSGPVLGWGLLKLHSLISPFQEIWIHEKHSLDTLNCVRIFRCLRSSAAVTPVK